MVWLFARERLCPFCIHPGSKFHFAEIIHRPAFRSHASEPHFLGERDICGTGRHLSPMDMPMTYRQQRLLFEGTMLKYIAAIDSF
jgi:hypothetical protein